MELLLFNSKEKDIEFKKYLLNKEEHINHLIKLHNNSCSDKDFENNIEESKGYNRPFKVYNLKHEFKKNDGKYYILFDEICFNFEEDSESNGIYIIDKITNELIFYGFFEKKLWFRKRDMLKITMKYEINFLDE